MATTDVAQKHWAIHVCAFLPLAAATDSSGNVYVADANTNNHCIRKFTPSGVLLTKWGTPGTGDGQFSQPRGVSVDSSGYVYVTDSNRIQKFSSSDAHLFSLGSYGTGNGQFVDPKGIACDNSGNIYVGDAGNNRIQKFNQFGDYQYKWGVDAQEQIAFDGTDLLVAQPNNNCIRKFSTSAADLGSFGQVGTGDGMFNGPMGVAVNGTGNVYVADAGNHRIQKFDSTGTFLLKWGGLGTGYGQFMFPMGLAHDGQAHHLYVVELFGWRIQKFDSISLVPGHLGKFRQ